MYLSVFVPLCQHLLCFTYIQTYPVFYSVIFSVYSLQPQVKNGRPKYVLDEEHWGGPLCFHGFYYDATVYMASKSMALNSKVYVQVMLHWLKRVVEHSYFMPIYGDIIDIPCTMRLRLIKHSSDLFTHLLCLWSFYIREIDLNDASKSMAGSPLFRCYRQESFFLSFFLSFSLSVCLSVCLSVFLSFFLILTYLCLL